VFLKTYILIFYFLTIPSVYGQLYEVTRYADDSGLPSRIVRDVDQDSEGYLWVAGHNGLFKFDGQKFHGYYASLKDTIGLRDNKINTILAASDGKIWIATPKGLHVLQSEAIVYVKLMDKVLEDTNYITDLFEDSNENVWVSSYNGFHVIEKKNGEICNFVKTETDSLYRGTFWGISEDSKGRIWVSGSYRAPLVSEKGSFNFSEVPMKIIDSNITSEISPYKYIEYEPDAFLISSSTGLLNGTLDANRSLTIRKFYNENGEVVSNENLYNTIIDSDRNIWTATWNNYFKKYKLEEGLLVEQQVISRNGMQNMQPFARSIFQDSQKNIWIPNVNGLFKLSETNGKAIVFPPSHIENCLDDFYSIYGIAEDNAGHLWMTNTSSLFRFNKRDILDNNCPEAYLQFKGESYNQARNLFVDSQNRLWISGQGGISITQLDSNGNPGSFVRITTENDLEHLWTFEVVEEDPNTFWVGNYHRLVSLKFPNGDLTKPLIKNYNSSQERDDALVNSYTIQLAKDKNNNLWIGTFNGLSRLISSEGEGTFKNYLSAFGEFDGLSNNAIKKIFKDSKDRLWIGTQTGLNLYNEDSDTFTQFGRKEGLPSEYILGIQEDSKGNLWVATTNGVFKGVYNESMTSFVHIEYFNTKDGLADNITNKNALYIDKDDNVFIGSSMGLAVIGTSEPSMEARSFNMSINTIESIQEKEQGFTSIKNDLNDGKIELSHKENSVRLSYAVLDFTNPEFNNFRHKFLPVSNEWIETGNTSELTYYNLSPGEYELILDGNNNQGIWSKDPIHLKIVVLPPFWKSGWAMVLYSIFVIGIISLFYRMRIRKRVRELEQETRLERALIREREQLRNENAADFHDELGSKVTKISMFLTLAERTLEEDEDPSNWFGKIRENVKDLSGSFRDLLWVIDPKKDSLSDAILRLKDFGEDLFSSTDTRYSTSGYSEELAHTLLDAQTKKQVVLIFKEAMHNCAKYADSTIVELTIESSEGYSSIRLKDNGKGFNVHRQSKGRGLTNMKNRSEKIGGNLSIVSSEQGTVVSLHQIPHLSEDNNDKEL
jgi:ligand-binding sensor domain-containing protein/signal transduction histidine kinase